VNDSLATPVDGGADVVSITARAHERDRYLSALLGPVEFRADLIALAAFAGEVGRIPAFVTEPMMGRIRLQWWHERIRDQSSGGHPVASAIIATMNRRGLPAHRLIELIDAHEDSLDDRSFGDVNALTHYVDRIDGTLFALSAAIAGSPANPGLATSCGRAYGLARVLLETPATLAHGRLLLPLPGTTPPTAQDTIGLAAIMQTLSDLARRDLAAISRQMRQMTRRERTAFLPVALVEPYLGALHLERFDLRASVEINPLRRVWRLWRCHSSGKV
jgi:15-cis-phytoene synthase